MAVDPAEALAAASGDRSIEVRGDLIAQQNVGDQERQELDRGEELVIDAVSGVEPGALVVDHPIIAIGQAPEAHRRTFHEGDSPWSSWRSSAWSLRSQPMPPGIQ
jgi:hypothetical protein